MKLQPLVTVFFFGVIFILYLGPVADPDFWWHLKTGEVIAQQGIPRVDAFSFTRYGYPIAMHEWLFELLLWRLYSLFGIIGISFVTALSATATLLLVWLTCRVRNLASLLILLVGFMASWHATGSPRPYLVTYFFLALTVYLLGKVKRKEFNPAYLYGIALLMVVWVNTHVGYLAGISLLVVFCICETAQLRFLNNGAGYLDLKGLRILLGVTGLSMGAAFISPAGLEGVTYSLQMIAGGAQQAFITEWQPTNFLEVRSWFFLSMFCSGLWCLFLDRKRSLELTQVFLFLGTGIAGFMSVRNIPLFVVIGTPILVDHCTRYFSENRFERAGLDPRSARLFVLYLAVLGCCLAFIPLKKLAQNEIFIRRTYPVDAVDFLKRSGFSEKRIFNNYDWGGYLIWRGIPVFIDGRADFYGSSFMQKYSTVSSAGEDWQKILNDYQVDILLLEKKEPFNAYLKNAKRWREVYSDSVAKVYLSV